MVTEANTIKTTRIPSAKVILLAILGVLALLWIAPTIAAAVSAIDLSGVEHPYLIIGGFVVLDAVIPIFPSESLLTTASNLAAQDGSNIELWRLIVAGSLGAIIGDSLLYWLARTVLRPFMTKRVEQAQQNEKVARSMEVMSQTAPTLIVFGRFVPGLRFMVGATMGLTKFPYRRFLLWDAIGGTLWAAYTCIFCYLIASVIQDKPLISIVTSVIVTTGLLALLYRPLKRHWDATAPEPAPDPATKPASGTASST
jgi:membrane protein DedA with SNARE-associated domain